MKIGANNEESETGRGEREKSSREERKRGIKGEGRTEDREDQSRRRIE